MGRCVLQLATDEIEPVLYFVLVFESREYSRSLCKRMY